MRYRCRVLIVCSGPDTYHARKKARELVVAFREKHDPAGYSTEIRQEPDIQTLLGRIGAPSLFAQKRMIRCDGLLSDMKVADARALAKRLAADMEQTIVLTVEDEPMASKLEKEFSSVKLVVYANPLLTGAKFASFVANRAKELGVSAEIATQITRNTDGDAWLADQEIQKCSANPNAPLVTADDAGGNVFDVSESFITDRPGWRSRVETVDDPGSVVTVFLSQARSFARVKDGETADIHPYAVRKLSALRAPQGRNRSALHDAIMALAASRQGVSTSSEENVLL